MPIPLSLLRRGQVDAAYELVSRDKDRFSRNAEYATMLVWIADSFLKADKRHADAFAAYRIALEADPDCLPALNNLAWHLAAHPDIALRNGAEAVRHAKAAAALTEHEDASVLDTLAAAYAEAGDFDQAVKTGSRALEIARRKGDGALETGIRRAVESYHARRRP
jgi:tetratricopeptide (TPR) repeat protein